MCKTSFLFLVSKKKNRQRERKRSKISTRIENWDEGVYVRHLSAWLSSVALCIERSGLLLQANYLNLSQKIRRPSSCIPKRYLQTKEKSVLLRSLCVSYTHTQTHFVCQTTAEEKKNLLYFQPKQFDKNRIHLCNVIHAFWFSGSFVANGIIIPVYWAFFQCIFFFIFLVCALRTNNLTELWMQKRVTVSTGWSLLFFERFIDYFSKKLKEKHYFKYVCGDIFTIAHTQSSFLGRCFQLVPVSRQNEWLKRRREDHIRYSNNDVCGSWCIIVAPPFVRGIDFDI